MNFNQNNNNKSMTNSNLKIASDFIANKMPSVISNHSNPIETLSPEDITYLQKYLEQIKIKKLMNNSRYNNPNSLDRQIQPDYNNGFIENSFLDKTTRNRANEIYDPLNRTVPVDWRTYNNNDYLSKIAQNNIEPGSRGSAGTRMGKRSQQNMDIDTIKSYYNPYEYGTKQNILPPQYKPSYNGPYDVDPILLKHMGVSNENQYPSHIRNINVESSLLQKETTHIPGQRDITEKEMSRFDLLPFDPQDHRHIIWPDSMPRGGFATRSERLELDM
jgi:hypothetical protein